MEHGWDPVLIAVTSIAVMVVFWLVLGLAEAHLRARADAMRQAKEALNLHFDALEKVLNSSNVSHRLKIFLSHSSDVFASRGFAERLASSERPVLSAGARIEVDATFEEITKIRKTDGDLASAIDDIILGGVIASNFWLPSTPYQSRIASGPLVKRESERIKRVIEDVAASDDWDLQPA